MKQKRLLLSIFFCIVSLFSSIQSEIKENTNTPPTTTTSRKTHTKNTFNQKALVETFGHLQKIDQMLGQLAMLISNNQVKQITNKSAVREMLTERRLLISGILQEQEEALMAASQDPKMQKQLLDALIQLCEAFRNDLEAIIKNNLVDLKPFDVSVLTQKRGSQAITQHTIQTKLTTTKRTIETLEKNINFIGLTWYNKATRTFDKYCVAPCMKYHVPTIATVGGGTVLMALWMLWKNPDTFDENSPYTINKNLAKLTQKLTDLLGEASRTTTDPITGNLKSYVPPKGIIPNIDVILTQGFAGGLGGPMILGGALLTSYSSLWTNSIKPWLEIHRSRAWNFLLGGSHEQAYVKNYLDFEPMVPWESLVGQDALKKEFLAMAEYLKNPEQFNRINLNVEKGWLLTGPTRTGKSFCIEAFCSYLQQEMPGKVRFWKPDVAAIKYFGIKHIFEMAKEIAPVVIFIDEIHLLLSGEDGKTFRHDFLTSMQTTMQPGEIKPIIVFAATNEETNLPQNDPLRQPGRLGKNIRLEYPTLKYRKIYLANQLRNMALNPGQFDLDSLAHKTDGKSYEDLRAMIRDAMTHSWLSGKQLTQEAIELSLNKELRNIIIEDRKELADTEKVILASHFAGRALAMMKLPMYEHLDTVTIKATHSNAHEYGALYTKQLKDGIQLKSHQHIINEIKSLIAGFVAEELLLGSCSYKCHPKNNEKAYELIEHLVFTGLNPTKLAKTVQQELATKAYTLFNQYTDEVRELLTQNKETLETLAHVLMVQGILNDAEVYTVIEFIEKKQQADSTKETEQPIEEKHAA